MNLNQEQRQIGKLDFNQSQRLMLAWELQLKLVKQVKETAATLRNQLNELRKVRSLILSFAPHNHAATRPWTEKFYFRFNTTLATLLALVCLVPMTLCSQPRPQAGGPTNVSATALPLSLAWIYTPPNGTDTTPTATVVQWWTNGGALNVTNVPAHVGTNRVVLSVPSAQWNIVAWGTDGRSNSSSASIVVGRYKKLRVDVSDLTRTTNRPIYSGPLMPGELGFLTAWKVEGWEQK